MKNINAVPLPKDCLHWHRSRNVEYKVESIEKEHYDLLNNTVVTKLPSGSLVQRRVIDKAKRQFKRDEEGNYVFEKVVVPNGSSAVLSNVKISLPYSMYLSCEDGFGYVDYRGSKYLYIIPNDYLYKINLTALVLSVKNMKCFSGMCYQSWDMGKVFLNIIPYNPNAKYTGSKVLCVKRGLDYSKEVQVLVGYWQMVKFIPPIGYCDLEDGSNLCILPDKITVGYEEAEYEMIEPISLKARVSAWEEE